jgi:hypothetical protein
MQTSAAAANDTQGIPHHVDDEPFAVCAFCPVPVRPGDFVFLWRPTSDRLVLAHYRCYEAPATVVVAGEIGATS